MKNVYIFSGLGADKKVFQKLDFSYCNVTFIEWTAPLRHESIEHYASQILSQIKHANPIIIGLSFGGMMAVEVAKLIKTEKVILIASAKNSNEIPLYYRCAGKVKLHYLLPAKLFKTPNFFSFWFFGVEQMEDKRILRAVLKDTDERFLKWAINAIVKWNNCNAIQNVVHIHGSADRILPIKYVKANIVVEKGGHFMTLNKAKKVSEILREELTF